MEKKIITIEENQTIEIKGVVLTSVAINSLKILQENENEALKRIINDLAETVCFITKEAVDYQGTDKNRRKEKLLRLSLDISYYRDYLYELKRPE